MYFIKYLFVFFTLVLFGSIALATDLPDLYMYYDYTPPHAPSATTAPVNMVIQNRGKVTTSPVSITVVCFQARGVPNVVATTIQALPLLAPWQDYMFSLQVPNPQEDIHIYCEVDTTNNVQESNEKNNRTPNKYIPFTGKQSSPPSSGKPSPSCGKYPCDFVPLPRIPIPTNPDYSCGKYPCDFVPLPIVSPQPPCGWRGKISRCVNKKPILPPTSPSCGKYPCDFVPLPRIPTPGGKSTTSCFGGDCSVASVAYTRYTRGSWIN